MKYAIFLGAGASASCGAPVQNNLFKEYFKNRSNISRRHCFDADKMATFFCSQFGINVEEGNLDNVDFPTFEEVLGILDLALAKDESFRECGLASEDHNPSNSISQLRQMVVDLMAYTIYHQVNFVENKHKELIRSLDSNKLLDDCFFISTNYDILIDNAITDKGHSIDYGCHMVNHAFCVENEFNSNVKTIPLYKIHGSLNWLYCPTCNEMTLTCGKGAIDGEKKSCDTCKGLMQKIIIPPTYFKNFNNYFL
ncbi:MAG TPA: hypothetical protein DEQ02_00040, partial [Ruminococcaceae bacterium]|nr:hypothetical protein [Oscillospiraceae bacterium]